MRWEFSPHLRIARVEKTKSGALGFLSIDKIVHSWTLQPDPSDTHLYIPQGRFIYRRHHGTKYPNTFEILVKGHTALLFHPGNTEEDTQGCILLGYQTEYLNNRRLIKGGTSRPAFEDFMKKMESYFEGWLTIEDLYPKGD